MDIQLGAVGEVVSAKGAGCLPFDLFGLNFSEEFFVAQKKAHGDWLNFLAEFLHKFVCCLVGFFYI